MMTAMMQRRTEPMKVPAGFQNLLCLALLLMLCCPAAADVNAVNVMYPPDRTVMEFDRVAVALKVPADAAAIIKVYVNTIEKLRIKPDSTFECFHLPLVIGENTIRIVSTDREGQDRTLYLSVFRRSDLESRYRKPPDGFRKDYFHGTDRPACAECHTLQPGPEDRKPVSQSAFADERTREAIGAAASRSTCSSCHSGLTARPFTHWPAALWSCLSCHDTDAGQKYAVKKPDIKACFGCHLEQKEQWYSKSFLHGPFNTGMCAICHNPHGSDYPFTLINNTWELCVSCHVDKGSGQHVVMPYTGGQYHPTRGKADPLRPGQELTCASCHDPHAANNRQLWRLNVGTGFQLCILCHA